MDSRVFKIKPNSGKPFPYFGVDRYSNYIWLITGPAKNKNFVTGIFVSGNHNYQPFELSGDVRLSDIQKVDRMKLSFIIGTNLE